MVWLWISERKLLVCALGITKCSWRVAGELGWEMKVSGSWLYWEAGVGVVKHQENQIYVLSLTVLKILPLNFLC